MSDVVAGIQWAIDNEMDIISMSLGSNSHSATLQAACDNAYEAGILLVAAAGNDYQGWRFWEWDTVDYPARYDSVIAVGATNASDTKASWSSTGPDLELAAPGVSIYSTYLGGGYATMSGTSMACPHVAGVAALVWAGEPELTKDQVRARLRTTADDLGDPGRDEWYGYGLLDADEAAPLTGPTDTTPPDISNVTATNVTSDSATITWTTDEASDSVVIYGTDTQPTTDVSDTAMVTSHVMTLTGLSAETTYVYEVQSTDAAGNTATDNSSGSYYTFTTESPKPPSVDTSAASDVTHNSATLNGELKNLGSASSVDVSFEYGTSTGNYPYETTPETMIVTGAFSANLSDLSEDTTYYFRAKAVGDETSYGVENSFTTEAAPAEEEVFYDSFESSADWTANWSQDSQNDWRRRTARKKEGNYAAEVDGRANDAQLISRDIDVSGASTATLTFSWFIERGLDKGEYLALDLSVDGDWDLDVLRLDGNVDDENVWHNESVDLGPYIGSDNFKIQFRGTMSRSREDAYVDVVKVVVER